MKQRKGCIAMKRITAVLLAALLLLPLTVSAETAQAFPLFESSFLQGWLCRDWTAERFRQELDDMKAAGFRSVILQSAVDLTHTETDVSAAALYPSSLAAGSEQSHALEYVLQSAAETGMQIRIGLVSDDRWWDYGWDMPDADFRNWLAQNTADQCTVIREIAEQFGERYAMQIAGFYYPNEIWNVTPDCADAYVPLYAAQLSAVRNALAESFPEHSLMLSPFYNKTLGEPEAYSAFLAEIIRSGSLRRTDILALQDGAGRDYDAGTLRLWQDTVYAACGDMITVWINNETFTSDYSPLSADRLCADYLATSSAGRHILFSWNHYYHWKEQESGFDQLLQSMAGDINADGTFDADDAACLVQWLCGTGNAPGNWNAGDADGSGDLNAADLTLLKRHLMPA